MKGVMLAIVLGLTWASYLVWLAFQDNNQGEYIDPQSSAIVWGSVVPLFLANFMIVFAPVALIFACLQWAYRRARNMAGRART
jgi:hypothetical protein